MTDTLLERSEGTGMSTEERESLLASLRTQHRFVKWWEIDGFGLIVCRRMRRTETITFTRVSQAANKKFEASDDPTELMQVNENAVKTTCVWPADAHKTDFLKTVFEEYPQWSGEAAAAIAQLASEGIKTEGKG